MIHQNPQLEQIPLPPPGPSPACLETPDRGWWICPGIIWTPAGGWWRCCPRPAPGCYWGRAPDWEVGGYLHRDWQAENIINTIKSGVSIQSLLKLHESSFVTPRSGEGIQRIRTKTYLWLSNYILWQHSHIVILSETTRVHEIPITVLDCEGVDNCFDINSRLRPVWGRVWRCQCNISIFVLGWWILARH